MKTEVEDLLYKYTTELNLSTEEAKAACIIAVDITIQIIKDLYEEEKIDDITALDILADLITLKEEI